VARLGQFIIVSLWRFGVSRVSDVDMGSFSMMSFVREVVARVTLCAVIVVDDDDEETTRLRLSSISHRLSGAFFMFDSSLTKFKIAGTLIFEVAVPVKVRKDNVGVEIRV